MLSYTPKVTLAEYTYDELGRLQTQKPHGSATNPVTYTYNIRNWLTGITSNRFTQNLYYNTGYGVARYNGNISSMTWKAAAESTLSGYKFTYDGLDRLSNAGYGETSAITGENKFGETPIYDKHGNITGLQRYGKTSSAGYGLIDDLTFGYTGNRMQYVNDASTATPESGTFHFVNASNSTGNEYLYDANGNMTKDLNKNITDIQYNILNSPLKVTLSSGGTTSYVYDAAGVKRQVKHQGAGVSKTTDYCGNVIYENGALSKILTEEGYITLSGTTPTYHYYLKDHLGNNRVVLNQDGSTVEQVNHYYPFGGVFDQTAEATQPYKYNGKELDRTYGLDLYDYSARYMDGAIGRFTTMDPLAEKYYGVSPYAYCAGNPVRYVDPNGKEKIIVLNPNDPKNASLIAAANNYKDDRAIHIWGHGNPNSFSVYDADKKGDVKIKNVDEFQKFLNKYSLTWQNKGERDLTTIILHSCETGKESKNNMNPIAQKLSKGLENTVVRAPSEMVVTNKENNEMGTYSTKTVDGKTVVDKPGHWFDFKDGDRINSYAGDQPAREQMRNPSWLERLYSIFQ